MVDIPTPLHPGKAGAKTGARCQICDLPHKLRSEVERRLIAGDKVAAVYRWVTGAFPAEMAKITQDVLYRHRNQHVRSIERAARKLSDATRMQRERVDLAKSVLKGDVDPQSFFSPAQLAQDIGRTEKRLDSAATNAAETQQHSALASLSGTLIRSFELRAKLGGHVQDKTEISISLGLEQLHGRLDSLVGAPTGNRQSTARNLLGLAPPTDDPLPDRRRPIRDLDELSNPGGASPLTIDADPVAPPGRAFAPSEAISAHPDPESRLASHAGGNDSDDPAGPRPGFSEPIGTRFR